MGKSSCGKDTIYRELMKREELSLAALVPYTTRPIRKGERDGVVYHFTDEDGYQELLKQGLVMEERGYQTMHGLWRYFTVREEDFDLTKGSYLLIGTLETFCSLKDYLGEDLVLPVYVETEDGQRLERALRRERKQAEPKYTEMCRRFLADDEDFSDSKLEEAGVKRRFPNNGELTDCLEEIVCYLKEIV